MKVIFLDIDGVLNSEHYFNQKKEESKAEGWYSHRPNHFDEQAVVRLNELVEISGAKVVISSNWRYGAALEQFRLLLGAKGFKGEVLDVTPILPPKHFLGTVDRGEEIQAWLDKNSVESFVILDDLPVGKLSKFLVQTSSRSGLQPRHVVVALRLLQT